MKYKALMLDVDGTLIPYNYASLPSEKVAQAVKKAQEKVTVSLVTGRSYGPHLQEILDVLGIKKGFVVGDNGARIWKIPSLEKLYNQPISQKDSQEIVRILTNHHIVVYPKGDSHNDTSFAAHQAKIGDSLESVYMFYALEDYSQKQIDAALKDLSKLPNISVWMSRHKSPNQFGLNISHVKATKLHGVEVVMKDLGIKREEIIAIGDSYNDFSLLMASGLKIAMGNAIDDLKAVADFVAPSVFDDGVATVIEKFILEI